LGDGCVDARPGRTRVESAREDAATTTSNHAVGSRYLVDLVRTFRNYKALADGALSQVSDADLHTLVDPDANSIAVIVKHLTGNLRSRFTDFLATDGEKPDRDRDAEFEMPARVSRDDLVGAWEDAWAIALASVEALTPDDLERTVTIRGEPFLVLEAVNRLAAHAAYHVGQIVLLAKHFAGPSWRSLSIPKGRSKQAKGTYKQGIIPTRSQ
jgi:hypothetical protein